MYRTIRTRMHLHQTVLEKKTSGFHENIWKKQRQKNQTRNNIYKHPPTKNQHLKPKFEKNTPKQSKTATPTNQPTHPKNQPTQPNQKNSRWSFHQTSKELDPEPAPLLAYPASASLDPVSRPRTALYHGSE